MQVQIIRSPRRSRSVSATLKDGILVVRVPEGLTPRQEQEWVARMRERLERRAQRRRLNSDSDLPRRAQALNQQYFGGRLTFTIRWVSNQETRWGSCTPSTGAIRVSHQLASLPRYVLDYVIVHELAHLIRPDHSPAFWELVRRYPHAERAIGFLQGHAWGRQEPPEACF
jgi:predicted metal-dependent hydrolase